MGLENEYSTLIIMIVSSLITGLFTYFAGRDSKKADAVASLTGSVASMTGILDHLYKDRETLSGRVNKLEDDTQHAKKERDEAKIEIMALQVAAAEKDNRIKALTARQEELEKKLETATSKASAKEGEAARLQMRIAELETSEKQLKEQIALLQQQIGELMAERDADKQKLAELQRGGEGSDMAVIVAQEGAGV